MNTKQDFQTLEEGRLFEELFPEKQTLEIEIGCGKGKFILERAKLNPQINFIGLDWAFKWMKVGIERAQKAELTNLRFFCGNAEDWLKHHVRQESVNIFHIYFPDPWPKKRHNKRRILTAEYFQFLYSLLKVGGKVELATDYQEYFEMIQQSLKACQSPWRKTRQATNCRLFCPELRTNYEIKYAKEGRPLYYIELLK